MTNLDMSIQLPQVLKLEPDLEVMTYRSGMIVYARKNVRLDVISMSS